MKRKNIFKSLLAAAMALIMIFGAAPLSGFVGIRLPMLSLKAEAATTEDGLFEYKVEKIWTEYGYTYGVRITRCNKKGPGKVVVPEAIEGYEVKWISSYAFSSCKNITEITIPDSVTEIGDSAFSGCTSLSKVQLFNGLTKIGHSAFRDCKNLTEITIPDGVTEIGDSAFLGCKSLTEITVSPDNKNYVSVDGVLFSKDMSALLVYPAGNERSTYTVPDSVTEIGNYAFYNCTSLSKVQLSNGLTKIGNGAFYYCENLTEITIPDSVTEIGNYAFDYCTSLSKVKLSNGLTKIGNYAFYYCENLTEITIPDSVTEIGNSAFYRCTSLSKVQLSNGLTKIGNSAFRDCENLTEITIPDSVTEIGNYAFYNCTSLSKAQLSNGLTKIGDSAFGRCENLAEITIPDSVMEIGNYAFSSCSSLVDITVSPDNKNYVSVDGVLFSKDMSILLAYPAGNNRSTYTVPDGVTQIVGSAFSGCTLLSKVQLSNALTKIGNSAFSGCINLTEITIPDGVTEIGNYAFDYCTSLSKAQLPNSLTKIGDSAFRDCKRLTEITIPDGVTEIGNYAFDYCTSLSKVKLSNGLTKIGNSAFRDCKRLTEITIPDSVTEIGNYAFSGCSSLVDITVSPDNKNYVSVDGVLFSKDMSILLAYPAGNNRSTYTVPDGVTQIEGSAFSGCTSLKELTIPDSVMEIGNYAFSSCSSLVDITVSPDNKNYVSVDGVLFSKDMSTLLAYPAGSKRNTYTVPDGVTQIGGSAFSGCTSLSKVQLPNGLTKIGDSAFGDCKNLKEITISDSVTEIGSFAFCRCTSLSKVKLSNSLTKIGDSAFRGCISLTDITVSPDNKNFSSVDGVLFSKDMSTLLVYPAGNKRSTYIVPDGVTEIGNYAFDRCTSLSKVQLPNGLTKIGDDAFDRCENLAEITMPDSVTEIGSFAFYRCTSLSKVKLSNGLTEIGSFAFSDCKRLAEITIPDSVTEIGKSVFSGCSSLVEITVSPDNKNYVSVDGVMFSKDMSALLAYPAGNKRSTYTVPDSVTKIDDAAFFGCVYLTDITVSSDNKNYISVDGVLFTKNMSTLVAYPSGNERSTYTIPYGVKKICVFAYCENLKEIVFPDSVIDVSSELFIVGCYSFTNITVSPGNKMLSSSDGVLFAIAGRELIKYPAANERSTYTIPDGVEIIYPEAFAHSKNLKSVTISESVTEIYESAFMCCTSLREITIPKSVIEIDDSAFENCDSLKNVYYLGTRAQWKAVVIGTKNEALTRATVHCIDDPPCDHVWGEWEVVEEATYEKEGLERRACSLCNIEETRVIPKLVRASAIELSESEKTVFVGDTFTITATVKPEDAFNRTVTWSSSDPSIATVDENGTVTAIAKGEAIITAESADGVTAECKVTVEKKVAAIELSESEKTVFVGDTFTITATVKPEDAFNRTVTWSSSDPSIATVDENGTVTAIAKGEATITAESADGVKAECKVTVEKKVAAIELSESEKTVFVGDTFTITATVKPEDAFNRTVTWSSSDPSIATVDENGTVTAIAKGEAIITAESADGVKAECKVTVEKKVSAIELSESEKTVFVGDTFTITATVKPEDAFNRTVTWSSSDPSIATVDENGTVTAIAEGEAIITAESADGVTAECKVTVEKKVAAIELSESEKTVFVGDTFTITATVKPEDAFNRTVTWSSSDPSIATVDENGTVTAIAKGEAIITAESADGVKAECKVTVEKKVSAIELSESEKTVFVGDTFTITATVKPEDAFNRTVTWSSSDPSIATVDENGTVTAIAEGEAIITAESADGVTAECKVTVEKKESFGKKLLNVITAPFRAIINLFKKLFGK